MTSRLMLVTFLAFTGCREGDGQAPLCDWVEEEVPLDYSLGPWGGDLNYDLQPGKVLELLTVPVQGTLMWKGGGDWASVTPSEGMTGFSSTLVYGDSVIYRRVPGAEGDLALACLDTLDFGASIHLSTDDGVLDETWETTVSFGVSTGSVMAEVDAPAVGLPETLQVVPNPDPPVFFDNVSYWMPLFYDIYLFSPELPTTVSGSLYFRGDFEPTQDGEIMDFGGVNRQLMEWVGSSEE